MDLNVSMYAVRRVHIFILSRNSLRLLHASIAADANEGTVASMLDANEE